MLPWYRDEKAKIAAMALAAGLLLGGILTFVAGGSSRPTAGPSKKSVAAAIASDQARAKAAPAPAKAKAKPKPKPKPSPVKARKTHHAPVPAVAGTPNRKATPTATPNGDVRREHGSHTPTTPVAAPRRQAATRRIVSKRQPVITPKRPTTKAPTSKAEARTDRGARPRRDPPRPRRRRRRPRPRPRPASSSRPRQRRRRRRRPGQRQRRRLARAAPAAST